MSAADRAAQRKAVAAYFAEHPASSLNHCCRWLNNRGLALRRDEVAALRRESGWVHPSQPQPAPPAPIETPVPAEPKSSTFEERRLAAIKLFGERPDIHPDEAKTILRERFGMAMGDEFIYALARDAREEAGLEQLQTRERAQMTRPLDVTGLPALKALEAVARALKGIPDMDAVLTLRGGKVELTYSLIATGKMEV